MIFFCGMPEAKYTLTTDCFVFPSDNTDEGSHIAYFPIQSIIFSVNEQAADLLKQLKRGPVTPENSADKEFLDHLKVLKLLNSRPEKKPLFPVPECPEPTRTILLLTDHCMLKCIYCYNRSGSWGDSMSPEMAMAAIDLIIKNAVEQKTGNIELGFHGGGEPTLHWSVLTQSMEYAQKRGEEDQVKVNSSICTNGIMPEFKAQWLAEHIQNIAVSIDGTPDIQNLQRPLENGKSSFDAVASTLDILDSSNRRYALRITVTEHSQNRLPEIVDFLSTRFKPSTLCIEPLFVCGRCETSGCRPPEKKAFIEDMIKAYEIGNKKNVMVQYSGNRISLLLSRFCGAQGSNFFITPRGDVTACLEISSRTDSRADFFMYGKYDQCSQKYYFDIERFKRLATSQVHSFDSCKDCFGKWHCGGDCLAKTPDFHQVSLYRNLYRCEVNKELIKRSLIKTMKHQLQLSEVKFNT